MRPGIDSIWKVIEEVAEYYKEETHLKINISEDKKKQFALSFEKAYNNLEEKYMRSDVTALDRHKVAALIICTIIDEEIIKSLKGNEDGIIFLGSEMIALSIGLSYMQKSLNNILTNLGLFKTITGYIMPTAMACKTDYFDILARNLYFAKTDYQLNPLDIADKLFLIEYLTLKDAMIDPRVLIRPDGEDENIINTNKDTEN